MGVTTLRDFYAGVVPSDNLANAGCAATRTGEACPG